MKSINDIQAEIVEEFALYDEWLDKYEYLIDLGRNLPLAAEQDKTDANLIEGCQSRVWLTCSKGPDGRLHFAADSDAIITKGLISLLIRVFEGQTPGDILAADLYFIDAIGLKENLSPTRAGGLAAMIKPPTSTRATYMKANCATWERMLSSTALPSTRTTDIFFG